MVAQTYQNALINISADFAEDVRAGCFSDRSREDTTLPILRAARTDQSW